MKVISTFDLRKFQQADDPFLLVNVLPAQDFESTRIANAVNIPVDEDNFVSRVEDVAGDKNMPVITYCASLQCPASTQAAEKLEAKGFTQVYDYKAGAEGWKKEQSPAAATRGRT